MLGKEEIEKDRSPFIRDADVEETKVSVMHIPKLPISYVLFRSLPLSVQRYRARYAR